MKPRMLLFASLLATCLAHSQQVSSQSMFIMNVDYARFKYDSTSAYLEVYYAFYPKLVTCEQVGTRFEGGVMLDMTLTDIQSQKTVRQEHSLLPIVVSDTSIASSRSTVISQAGYMVPFGSYRLRVMASDSLAPARRDSIELKFSLDPFTTVPAISDLELCSKIESSEDKTAPFYKNGLEIDPNATLSFGVVGSPVLFSYLELYNLDTSNDYSLRTQILDAGNKVVRQSIKPRRFAGKNAAEVGTFNVTSIQSGRYHMNVSLTDTAGKELARTRKVFYVFNPHVHQAGSSASQLKGAELAGLTSDELKDEFRKAQYVASDDERIVFSNITNPEGMQEFLSRFWSEVERGRPGKPAIRRSDYLDRVRIANRRFGNQTREGWSTDRGRVYILYGEPDDIERTPSQINAKPYETWNYYQIENGVQFVFIDRSQFGEYVLVHSTKRGELRDDNWQRYLQ